MSPEGACIRGSIVARTYSDGNGQKESRQAVVERPLEIETGRLKPLAERKGEYETLKPTGRGRWASMFNVNEDCCHHGK